MIENIEDKEIKINISDEMFKIPDDIKRKIIGFWNETTNRNPTLWNGNLMCVSSYESLENELVITCKKTSYAHYLYDERKDVANEYACHSLSAGCLLETSDHYYIVGELDKKTSYPRCLQPCGGIVEKSDLENGEISIIKTISREAKEELNIDLQNRNQVLESKIKYISLPDNKVHTYIIFMKSLLKMTKLEVEEQYKKYLQDLKMNNGEVEFCKLHFIKKDNISEQLDKLNNPKRGYLIELLDADSKVK